MANRWSRLYLGRRNIRLEMWYVAFSLGLMGSFHCLGMCGPLALAISKPLDYSKKTVLLRTINYHLGKTLMYALMGVLFGLISSLVLMAELQRLSSIILGVIMIFIFLLNKIPTVNKRIRLSGFKPLQYVQRLTNHILGRINNYHPFILGFFNGILPCGLVYVAIAGALTTGSVVQSMFFMALFGLGTIPLMAFLVFSQSFYNFSFRNKIRNILPYISLVVGGFLIYRGLVVEMPRELNFWEALKNPIMCH